jgi:hypothetical protein
MVKKFSSFLLLLVFHLNAFAVECPDDEKFVPLNENRIGYSMYKGHKTYSMEECI